MPSSAEYQKLMDEYKAFIDTPPVDVLAAKPTTEPEAAEAKPVGNVENKKPAEKKSPEAKRPVVPVAKEQADVTSMDHEPTLAELANPRKAESIDIKSKALKKFVSLKNP